MSQQLSPMIGTRPEVGSSTGVVSAGHPLAVKAGLRALSAGGNAIDATVAAAFAAFVAEPNNAGVGGYGHLAAYLGSERRFVSVDHSPRAPAAARADMYQVHTDAPLDGHDWPSVADDQNSVGFLAPAVPGAVAGLWAVHQLAGHLPWEQLLEPAISIAEAGLEISWVLLLEIASRYEEIRAYPALAAIVLPRDRLPRARTADGAGERLNQRDLAQTLRQIAQEGPDAFYHGPIAEKLAGTVTAGGGILSAADLAAYAPKVYDEQPEHYRGLEYVTAGDTVGYETLGIVRAFPMAEFGAGSARHFHVLAEAMGHAFADNATYSCDPDFAQTPVAELGSPAFAAQRAALIDLDRISRRPVAPRAPWIPPDVTPQPTSAGGSHGTTQVVAADRDGNLVSLITTIGADFGSLVAVPGTGVVLNNSMVNYDPRPGRSNSIAPGKMPFFAVPAIVATDRGKPAFSAAGSGGYPILAGVINTVVNAIDHGLSVQAAIDEPRVHSQGNRTFIDSRVDPAVRAELAEIGHELVVQDVTPGELPFSRVSAVTIEDGFIKAGAGPAWTTATGAL